MAKKAMKSMKKAMKAMKAKTAKKAMKAMVCPMSHSCSVKCTGVAVLECSWY